MAFRIVANKIESDILEIIAADHCNLSCTSCDHLAPISKKTHHPLELTELELNFMASFYHAKTVRILGGEPLLRNDLLELLKVIKKSQIGNAITLVTNGILMKKITPELLNELDGIDLSLYPTSDILKSDLIELRDLCKLHNVRLYVRVSNFFRHSFSAMDAQDNQLTQRIFNTCKRRRDWGTHTLYNGFFFKCSVAHGIDREILSGNGVEKIFNSGLKVEKNSDFFKKVEIYLTEQTSPLPACAYCLGSVGKKIAHEHISQKNWLAAHKAPIKTLVDFEYLEKMEKNFDALWDCAEDYQEDGFLNWRAHEGEDIGIFE